MALAKSRRFLREVKVCFSPKHCSENERDPPSGRKFHQNERVGGSQLRDSQNSFSLWACTAAVSWRCPHMSLRASSHQVIVSIFCVLLSARASYSPGTARSPWQPTWLPASQFVCCARTLISKMLLLAQRPNQELRYFWSGNKWLYPGKLRVMYGCTTYLFNRLH